MRAGKGSGSIWRCWLNNESVKGYIYIQPSSILESLKAIVALDGASFLLGMKTEEGKTKEGKTEDRSSEPGAGLEWAVT